MPPSESKPNTLSYNVAWSTRVFRSRAATEALLAPEHAAGNLTTNDYNASLQFLPGYHRYYPILGCIGATAFLVFRHPVARWTRRRALTAFTLGFTGYTFGKLTMVHAHYDYISSLENPAGFSKAMENVQARLGGHMPPGIIIQRTYEHSPDDQNDIASESPSQPSNQAPASKWEQIRKMNDHTAKNSSWDVIRQKHERSGATVKPSHTSSNSEPELFWDDTVNTDVDTAPTLSS